ncbi:M24 family metallopeptidase [Oceanispirochaeta crateris]|uniref:M24 family metallopeptidase n=1 Tax=Oceanispirochaeta crateris TaxID=2518645 RepID=A0A5C1QGR2_9SPIO|nr:M24 family metallopeptidase [Oceanispirochaeta crateris]QEN06741.1 M24 family metallopeptidase [Oceanispirochaeta crateris]
MKVDEINHKIKLIRTMMKDEAMEAVYIKKQANYSWLTAGGLNQVGIGSEMGAFGLLLTMTSLYCVATNIEATRAKVEERLEEKGFEFLIFSWDDEKGESRSISSIVSPKSIGSDCGMGKDLNRQIQKLRFSLVDSEIERYRLLGDQVSRSLEEVLFRVKPGDKECSVIGRLTESLWDHRIDYITIFCASDHRITNFRHPIATEKKIEKRVMLGVNARKGGLIVCLTRFLQFGPVDSQLHKQYRDNVEIDCRMIEATVPGTPVNEILKLAVREYSRLGYESEYKNHHQGGSIGYQGRDYRVNFDSPYLVQNNQGFCWNPSISGTKSEDTILATNGTPEFITHPCSFPTITVETETDRYIRPDILSV